MSIPTLRQTADRQKIAGTLAAVRAARFDVVAPSSALHWLDDMTARLIPSEPLLTSEGVLTDLAVSATTRTAFSQTCGRVRLPLMYADRLTNAGAHGAPLLAHNLNQLQAHEPKQALYRFLRQEDGTHLLRAVLSDGYRPIDNEEVLTAVMGGMADAGVNDGWQVDVDLTDDRFRMRIAVPQIALAVPDLLGDYQPRFTMLPGRDVHAPAAGGETAPVMWAGIEVSNSETGGGALRVAPRAVILVCRNGLTRPVDVLRQVHAGGRLESGVVQWSRDTVQRALELTRAQVRDAVAQFCSVDYLTTIADEMRAAKGITITSPSKAVEVLAPQIGLTEAEAASVLDSFATSGDMTALGLGQAVTAVAQSASNGDRQSDMEAAFWTVMEPQTLRTLAAV